MDSHLPKSLIVIVSTPAFLNRQANVRLKVWGLQGRPVDFSNRSQHWDYAPFIQTPDIAIGLVLGKPLVRYCGKDRQTEPKPLCCLTHHSDCTSLPVNVLAICEWVPKRPQAGFREDSMIALFLRLFVASRRINTCSWINLAELEKVFCGGLTNLTGLFPA